MVSGEMKTFLVSYNFEGTQWNIEVPARDYDDACARVKRLAFARVDGELILKLPRQTGPLAAVISSLRNATSRIIRLA